MSQGFAFPAGPFVPRGLLGGYVPMGYLGLYVPTIVPYVPPSPTGWKSSAVRRGPDPNFTTARRRAGSG